MWLIVVLGIFVLLREFWILLVLPGLAQALAARGERDRAIRLFERLLTKPTLWGERSKRDMRFRLAWLYLDKGQFDAAIEQCRAVLTMRHHPAIEANVRRRLADCLEAAGQTQEAAAERERAAQRLADAPEGAEKLIGQAKALAAERRWSEACALYEQAMPLIPRWNDVGRTELMVRLALASFEAGRPEQVVKWSEEALGGKPGALMQMQAHSAAGLGHSAQGRLEEAEEHRNKACALAVAAGNKEQAARYLTQLAMVQMDRGKLVEAIEACEKAAGLSLGARRSARMTQSECLRLWGRYEEARQMLEQARRAQGMAVPAEERRIQAVISLGTAWIDAEDRRPEAALQRLEEAEKELAQDEKIGLWCEATAAWVYALLGRREESEGRARRCESTLAERERDRTTLLTCHARLALAAYALGEYERSRALWQQYLEHRPFPVDRPRGLYFLGECSLQLQDAPAALAAFREAVEPGLDTYYSRLARERLQEMEPQAPQSSTPF